MATPGVSANMTFITLKSTPKMARVSQNTSQISTSTMTTTHGGSVTSVLSSVIITVTINSKENKGSKFDIGSFVGGITLILGILAFILDAKYIIQEELFSIEPLMNMMPSFKEIQRLMERILIQPNQLV